jgi:tRNA-specific 2-thiouridylase
MEVELVGNEDGVSPGQACVFYDAAEGQARVLGGGVISNTIAATTDERSLNPAAAGFAASP